MFGIAKFKGITRLRIAIVMAGVLLVVIIIVGQRIGRKKLIPHEIKVEEVRPPIEPKPSEVVKEEFLPFSYEGLFKEEAVEEGAEELEEVTLEELPLEEMVLSPPPEEGMKEAKEPPLEIYPSVEDLKVIRESGAIIY